MSEKAPLLDEKGLQRFGLTTGAIVAFLFGALLPWLFGHAFPLWPWFVATILGLWAVLLPGSLQPVYRTWMAVGQVLGWINTRILLGVAFYLVILPTGIMMRLLGKDPMVRKLDGSLVSYRVRSTKRAKQHVERPF